MSGHCCLCGEDTSDILDHLRVIHPDLHDQIERWPDGEITVHDMTVETSGDIR